MSMRSGLIPNNMYMKSDRIWRNRFDLEKKWSVAGEKKINHEISLNRWYKKWFTSWWCSTRHGQQISGSVFLLLLHLDSDAHNVFLSILSKATNIWSKKGFLSQYEDLMFPLVLVSTFFRKWNTWVCPSCGATGWCGCSAIWTERQAALCVRSGLLQINTSQQAV